MGSHSLPSRHDAHEPLSEIIGWDVENWSQTLAFWDERAQLPHPAHCLEIGSGNNSSLSLWLALRGNSVVCSDFGGVAESLKSTHRAHGVEDRISYADVDARSLPFREQFDVIVCKSVLGGVVRTDPVRLAREIAEQMHGALKPGGVLLLAENLRSTPVHHFARSYLMGRSSAWHYFSLSELERMLSGFRSVEFTTFGFLACFGRSEAQRRILGKLDKSLFARVPQRWHYIAAAIAYK